VTRIRVRNRYLLAFDVVALVLSCATAYSLRFEGFGWIAPYGRYALTYLACTVPIRLALYLAFGLYRRLWEHASITELERVLRTGIAGSAVSVAAGLVVLPAAGLIPSRVPVSIVGLDVLLSTALLALPRFAIRMHGGRRLRRRAARGKRVLIAGAGDAGQMTARELLKTPELGLLPIGFVDDDRRKHGHKLLDLPVLGAVSDIPRLLGSYAVNEVIIAMPTAPGTVIRQVVRAALDAGVQTRTVPGLFEILSGKVSVSSIRQVEIQDLLRRAPIETDLDSVRAMTAGRTVLVTGAGGSIGGELCRQLARLEPRELVLLGHGENSIFEIREELESHGLQCQLTTVIADIRDRVRIDRIVRRHRPHAIFHAAAHKHVPLMEANAIEALTNNVLGTQSVITAAVDHGTQHFVLISTDKAVRPTSVMGASKRIAEQIVQLAALRTKLSYVSVRFGNVLGSRGSVIPTFLHQIRAGGPVMVTHPEMRRYFITIPEAVQLVLQAFALGRSGEVFVLDMGEPVRIVDLAQDLIRLSGLQVGRDIDIEFSGMRPGEKLFEEMFFHSEQVIPTEHPKVLRARHAGLAEDVEYRLEALIEAVESCRSDTELRGFMREIVPDFGVPLGEPRPRHRTPTPTTSVAAFKAPVQQPAHKPAAEVRL
jgi:FlaA1/EpsC-like NDP-sugar epimerase